MSEYQYYEFQAVDRPLDSEAQAALRHISSRARITATSFTNHYDWGDLNADPVDLLKRYFDLHVYVANWGSRHFGMRLPRRLFDPRSLGPFGIDEDLIRLHTDGDQVVILITGEEVEAEEWDDGSGWLAALAPLRAAVLAGDLRMFYVLWLAQIDWEDAVPDSATEPLPGIAPLDGALSALADFLGIDPDLLAAAAETGQAAEPSAEQAKTYIQALSDTEKTALLTRLYDGSDPHLGQTLRRRVREALTPPQDTARHRTVAELREAAERVRQAREAAEEQALAAELRRQADAAAKARAARQQILARRGAAVWRDIEALIEQRKAAGYKEAMTMLADLHDMAGDAPAFAERMTALRARHASKRAFIARLDEAGLR